MRVSRISLGTMNFGRVVSGTAACAMLDHAVDARVNVIDTADVYGRPPLGSRPGQTEEILG
ncbi:aldo/keto reductase [Microbacterium insulae]|uniref:Aldo/keto reductase n=1 Tax=Microbacterium insulae TaxID=483014 RepID=A0ABW3AFR9_9MICO